MEIVKLHKVEDVNKIGYGNARNTTTGGEIRYLQLDGKDTYFQIDTFRSPFGASNVNRDDPSKTATYTMNLSFDEDNKKSTVMKEVLKKLSEKIINDCVENPDWVPSLGKKKSKPTYKTCEALFSQIILDPSDEKYPQTFRIKLPCDDTGKFVFDVYDTNKNKIESTEEALKYMGRNCKVRFLVKPRLWCKIGNGFGCTFQVFQAEVRESSLSNDIGYSFQDDDEGDLLAEDSD